MSEIRRFCRSLKLCWCLFRLTLLKKNFDNFIICKQKDSVILKSHCLFVLTSFFLSLLHITKLLRIFVENQFREMLKTPVFKAFYTVHDFQEKAFWNLSAFQAVFYAQIAALIMIGGIELTSSVRTWTKLNFTQFSLLLILSFIYN